MTQQLELHVLSRSCRAGKVQDIKNYKTTQPTTLSERNLIRQSQWWSSTLDF